MRRASDGRNVNRWRAKYRRPVTRRFVGMQNLDSRCGGYAGPSELPILLLAMNNALSWHRLNFESDANGAPNLQSSSEIVTIHNQIRLSGIDTQR